MDQFVVVEGSWAKSQSNHDILVATILRRKSCTLTINYNFWLNGKHSIHQLVSKARSRVRKNTQHFKLCH